MKFVAFLVVLLLPHSVCRADIIDFTTGGLGGALDLKTSGTYSVPGFSSLKISIIDVSADGVGEVANASSTNFGVDSAGSGNTSGDHPDLFDGDLNESITFSFNQAVLFSYLDFSNFDDGDVFQFGSSVIEYSMLSNKVKDEYNFSSAMLIGANSPFTVKATSGFIGLQRLELDLAAVPEPSSLAMCCLGLLLVGARHRRNSKRQLVA